MKSIQHLYITCLRHEPVEQVATRDLAKFLQGYDSPSSDLETCSGLMLTRLPLLQIVKSNIAETTCLHSSPHPVTEVTRSCTLP